jgi:hypothetical protein
MGAVIEFQLKKRLTRSTPENRIEKSLPSFQKISETKEYQHGESYKIKEFRYIFIDKIASELDLNKKFESIKRI